MAQVYREGNLDLLDGKVAVVGYGSQGHAHALNLRDSGVEVEVGLRAGSESWEKAEAAGLTVREIGDAVRGAQLVAILLPDHVQKVSSRPRSSPTSSRVLQSSSRTGSPSTSARSSPRRATT